MCVLGPTRMAYWRAVAMVRFIGDLLDLLVADALSDGGAPGSGSSTQPDASAEPGSDLKGA